MKFWVTLDRHEAEIEFHTDGDRLLLEIEGRRIEADFHRLPDGEVYSLIVDGRSHEVRVTPAADALEVTAHGRTASVEVRHPLEKLLKAAQQTGRASTGEVVNAPMPGVITALRVRVGDVVAAGQAVAVIEAMKMQNELTARHGGIVGEILVAERASVAAGQPLLRLRAPA
jgi:biotin carboxyl carrier protein